MKKSVYAAVTTAVFAALSQSALAQSYTVVELSKPENLRDTSGMAINNQGAITALGRFPLDLTIDLERITGNTRSDAGIPQDSSDETVTEVTEVQYRRLIPLLEDQINSQIRDQRIGMNYALSSSGGAQLEVDKYNDETSDNYYTSINDNSVLVGSVTGVYTEYVFTNSFENENGDTVDIEETYHERDYIRRGLWKSAEAEIFIEPEEQEFLGGESGLYDINENGFVVGYSSTSMVTDAVDAIEECQEVAAEDDAQFPTEACAWQEWHGRYSDTINVGSFYNSSVLYLGGSIYNNSATIWQLDENGNVVDSVSYGPIAERIEDYNGELSTYAYAINDNDIAVGQGWTFYRDVASSTIKMPAIFRNGESSPITEDDQYRWGSANDINNDNIVVGYLRRDFDGTLRDVGFVYDLSDSQPELIELPGFFESSATVPHAINDAGLVVGTAESESNLSTVRRRSGFLYDLNNPDAGFIDLNDAVGCNSDYFIVSADDINEQGQIIATAVTESSFVNEDGDTIEEYVTRAVRLDPQGGDIEPCNFEEEDVERQGASTSFVSLFGMLLIGGLITIRRKFFS